MADDNTPVELPPEVKEAMRRDAEKTASTQQKAQPSPSQSTPTQDAPVFSQQTDQVQTTQYPSEVIDLPSRGWFYPPESPLARGKVDIKYMTAKEEDILTSQNLIKKGLVLDKLLEELIVTPGISLDDILVGDKNAIFIAARILAYGKDYKVKFKDPSTGDDVEDVIDLTHLDNKEFDFESAERGRNLFEYELPYSKKKIHWSLLKHSDEKAIDAELKSLKKFSRDKNQSSEVTTRLKYVIKALDGEDDKTKIKKYVDTELLARDSLSFRNHIKENTPDIDLTFNFESEETGYTERMNLPLGVDFFYPTARV
tara:strand:+ start:49478 stop:50413 length:936 start_codon:yes stop_codon:yes gene_type:complete